MVTYLICKYAYNFYINIDYLYCRILLAIMLITAFLSLWLPNNESAAIMMLPVTILIVKEFVKLDKSISTISLIQLNKQSMKDFRIGDDCQCKQ